MKKLAEKINRVGLIANRDKSSGAEIIRQAAHAITASGRTALADVPTAEMTGLQLPIHASAIELARASDLLLVFGGDGTMLRVAREIHGARTPVLGINLGSLGFLTAVPCDDLGAALQQVWEDRFTIEERDLIESLDRAGGARGTQHALNDFVISRGTGSRMIELEVSVDNEVMTRYRCDGLIVSSPTGSTAYSLSAGGAVVSPAAKVFTITPICPHTLSNRSVIVSLDSVVKVKVLTPKPETILAADGQVESQLSAGDEVIIQRSPHALRLLRLDGHSFFQTLRQKLNWSGSNV